MSKKAYIILQAIEFLQQCQCLFRAYNVERNSYVVQLMGILSFETIVNNPEIGPTSQLIIYWVFNISLFVLSQLIILGMFFINMSPKFLKAIISIHIFVSKVLIIPSININFSQQLYSYQQTIGIIFLIIQMLSYMIIINYLGQDSLSYKSVQIFNQKGDIIDYVVKVVNNIFLTSIQQTIFKLISSVISIGHLALYIMIPIHMDIILYPLKVSLWGIFTLLQLVAFMASKEYLYTKYLGPILSVPTFILCYWGTQTRLKNVINKALIWLILRKQKVQDIKVNYEQDIEYIYIIPSLVAQFFIILYFLIGCPIIMVGKLLLESKNNFQESLYMRLQRLFEVKIELDQQYSRGLMQMRLKHQTITLAKAIVYKDYVKQIQKRAKQVELIKTQNKLEKQQYDIGFLTSYDYAFVMTFLSNSFMQYHALKVYEGEIVDDLLNNKAIDVEYLKHLQVISLTKYPTNKYIKLVYYTVLFQYLNDYEQAKSQIRLKLQLVISDAFKNQLQYNKILITKLFGDIAELFINQADDSYENTKYDLHSQKIIYKLTGETNNVSQSQIFAQLNKQWDALDQNFINLFNPDNDELQLNLISNFYTYYKTFLQNIKQTKRTSDNQKLYKAYTLAVQHYFRLVPIRYKKVQETLYYLAKFCNDAHSSEYNNEYSQIVNQYEPNNILMSIMNKIDVHVTILNNQRNQQINDEEIDMAIQEINTFSMRNQYGPSNHQLHECETKMHVKVLFEKNIPISKKYFCVLMLVSFIVFLVTTILLLLSGIALYNAFGYQVSEKVGYTQLKQEYNFVNLFKQNMRVIQTSIMYPVEKFVDLDQDAYLSTLQNILLEQLKQYSNPFSGVYIYNNKYTLFVGDYLNPITTINDLLQNINSLVQIFQKQLFILQSELFKKIKQLFISTLYMKPSKTYQPSVLFITVNVQLVATFIIPVLFFYSYYWIKYIMWRDYIHITRLFNEIPKSLLKDLQEYYTNRRDTRISIQQMYQQNIYLNIFKIISQNSDKLRNSVEVQIRASKNKLEEFQNQTDLPVQFLQQGVVKRQVRKLKFVKNILLIIALMVSIISYIFVFNDSIQFKNEILTNSVQYQQLNEQLYNLQRSFYKYQLLQKYFKFNDKRIYNIYLNLKKVSTYNYFQYIYQLVSEANINIDITTQLNFAFFVQQQMEQLEEAAICKYDGINYGNCTDNQVQHHLSELQSFNFTINADNYQSIISNDLVAFLEEQMTYSMQYIYQKVNKLITEINLDRLHKYTVIQNILVQTFQLNSIGLNNKNLFYTQLQHTSSNQFVNSILPKNTFDSNINMKIFKDYYMNISNVLDQEGFRIQHNQLNIQQNIYSYLKFLQYYLLMVEIICYILILLSDDLNIIHRFVLFIPVLLSIIGTMNFKVTSSDVNKIEAISTTNQQFFSIISELDCKVNQLISSSSYNEDKLSKILLKLYEFQDMYIMGQDDYAVRATLSNQTLLQKIQTFTFLLPLRKEIQDSILNMTAHANDSVYIYQLNPPKIKNAYYNIYLRTTFYVQQYLKIYYKSLAYYCTQYKENVSDQLYYSDSFQIIKKIQDYNQELLQIVISSNISPNNFFSISPPIYSDINVFLGYNIYNTTNPQSLEYSTFLANSYELVKSQQLIFTMLKGMRFQIQQDSQYYNTVFEQQEYIIQSFSIIIAMITFILFAFIVVHMLANLINYKLLSLAIKDERFIKILQTNDMSKQKMLLKTRINTALKLDYNQINQYYKQKHDENPPKKPLKHEKTKKKNVKKSNLTNFLKEKLFSKNKKKQQKEQEPPSSNNNPQIITQQSTTHLSNLVSGFKLNTPIIQTQYQPRNQVDQNVKAHGETQTYNDQQYAKQQQELIDYQQNMEKQQMYSLGQEYYINRLSKINQTSIMFQKLINYDWIDKKLRQQLFWMTPSIVITFSFINTFAILIIFISCLGLIMNKYQIELYEEAINLNIQAQNPLGALICELPENRTQCFFELNSSVYYVQTKKKLQSLLDPPEVLLPYIEQVKKFDDQFYVDQDHRYISESMKLSVYDIVMPVARWIGYYSYTHKKILFSKFFSTLWYQRLYNVTQQDNVLVPILETLNSDVVSLYIQQLIRQNITSNQTINSALQNPVSNQYIRMTYNYIDSVSAVPVAYYKNTSITQCAFGPDDYDSLPLMEKIQKALQLQACTQSLVKELEKSVQNFAINTFTGPCILACIAFIIYLILIVCILVKTFLGIRFTFLVKELFRQFPTCLFERLPLRYVLAVK